MRQRSTRLKKYNHLALRALLLPKEEKVLPLLMEEGLGVVIIS